MSLRVSTSGLHMYSDICAHTGANMYADVLLRTYTHTHSNKDNNEGALSRVKLPHLQTVALLRLLMTPGSFLSL